MEELGNRMKVYENEFKTFLPTKNYYIIRIDGRSFSNYCKGLEKPYDEGLMKLMDKVTESLCNEIQGVKLGYTQSDEISILFTDLDNDRAQLWFGGNVQKMTSISASVATSTFNSFRNETIPKINKDAHFDSRVFVLRSEIEIFNYFYWRYLDCVRNSVSLLAQNYYSHKQLYKKSQYEQKELIKEKGDDWENHSNRFKYGGLCTKQYYLKNDVNRSYWCTEGCEPFDPKQKDVFLNKIII